VICNRCQGAGQLDVIKKVAVNADGKTCSYVQARETCVRCGGTGIVDASSLPRGLVGLCLALLFLVGCTATIRSPVLDRVAEEKNIARQQRLELELRERTSLLQQANCRMDQMQKQIDSLSETVWRDRHDGASASQAK
jgi:hypothetical protein